MPVNYVANQVIANKERRIPGDAYCPERKTAGLEKPCHAPWGSTAGTSSSSTKQKFQLFSLHPLLALLQKIFSIRGANKRGCRCRGRVVNKKLCSRFLPNKNSALSLHFLHCRRRQLCPKKQGLPFPDFFQQQQLTLTSLRLSGRTAEEGGMKTRSSGRGEPRRLGNVALLTLMLCSVVALSLIRGRFTPIGR